MTQSSAVSARSLLIAGMSAAVVGAAVVTPVNVPALSERKIAEVATQLTGIESTIKNTYNAIEPWAAWGAELGQWALGFIPGLWWVAPGVDLAYFTIEPLVQAGVYTSADVLGLNFSQISPDISAGIQQSVNNAVTYSLAWLNSLVPFPPLPPFPPRPGAAVTAAPVLPAAATTTVVAGPSANSVTTPIEVAIKNTYNAVEPWAQYGMQWVDYVAGLVPIVNWFSPAIPLTYYTIEPLVRAGTYAFADLIGLNFSAIGPDIWNGITTSSTNFVNGILNWVNIPLPPRPPAAAVAAPAASVRAAAAVAAPSEVTAPGAEASNGVASNGQASTGAATGTVPKVDNSPEPAVAAEHSGPSAPVTASTVADNPAPPTDKATEATAPVSELAPPAVTDIPAGDSAPAEAPATSKGHRGPSAAAASGDSGNAGGPAKAGRHARGE